MLRKSYILSIIVITTLLVIQSAWIILLVDFEKDRFEKKLKIEFRKSISNELRLRRNSKTKSKTIDFFVMEKKEIEKKQLYPNHKKYIVDSKDVGENDLFSLNVEHVYQAILRKSNPLQLSMLSDLLSKSLDSINLSSDYILEYSDNDTIKNYSSIKSKIHFGGSFETFEYLSATKDMKISVLAFYPISVFKGDFLIITLASLLMMIFIFYSLYVQTIMLNKQISISQIKENLTNFLTHELRSPLQSALTSAEMIEKCSEKGDNNKILTYSKIVKNKLLSINNLIENVLEINKLKKKKEILNKEYFIISDIIDSLIDNYMLTEEKEINFDLDPSCIKKIYADKTHIFNAINNLIKNSVIYSKDRVNIRFSVCGDRKHTSIVVEDDGIGISNSHQEKIFDLFYRINTEEYGINNKGFGLGLNYVKWVAEAHGGKVKVESKEGKGSKFTLYIKAYEKECSNC